MKRIAIFLVSALLCMGAGAQTSTDWLTKYNKLVSHVGDSGVGVETMLDKWEADDPDDPDMMKAKFNFFFAKSQTTEVVAKSQAKFLGNAPMLTLKDSLGNPVNYYSEIYYDDELFGQATSWIDRAIKAYPSRIDLRFNKITALIAYEKESPDMAASDLNSLIDFNYTTDAKWTFEDRAFSAEDFSAAIQEYCYTFFLIASPKSWETFRQLSEKMTKYCPKETVFYDNIGTYWFVYKGDSKTALKYYNKVLKMDKTDYTAIKNCILMARKQKNLKMEKKYLQMLALYSPDEAERASADARVKAISSR